jgi:hypothetical protein
MEAGLRGSSSVRAAFTVGENHSGDGRTRAYTSACDHVWSCKRVRCRSPIEQLFVVECVPTSKTGYRAAERAQGKDMFREEKTSALWEWRRMSVLTQGEGRLGPGTSNCRADTTSSAAEGVKETVRKNVGRLRHVCLQLSHPTNHTKQEQIK